jgi:hypothetical protein
LGVKVISQTGNPGWWIMFNYATEVYYYVALLATTARKENVYSEESNAFDIRPSMLDIKVMFHVTDVNMAHLV